MFYLNRFRFNVFLFLILMGCCVPNSALPQTAGKGKKSADVDEKATDVVTITGDFEKKFEPQTAAGLEFNARKASFLNQKVKWGMINVEGRPNDTGMKWIGGYVYTNKPWDASWDDHKDLNGPTRNNAAFNNASTRMTIKDLHFFNVHDGVRTSDATDWVVEHNWGEYVRDDVIENDHLQSGRVHDCLFDGCFTGISTKPSASNTGAKGTGKLVELDRVLLRLQAMPYPYKWEKKKGIIDASGKPFTGSGSETPYGHGHFFKLGDENRIPHFSIKNCVFMATHLTEASKLDFPPESHIDVCENNVVIWLGPGAYPGKLPDLKFPDGVKIVTGQEGKAMWREKVTDWHARHPDVGSNRTPSEPGNLVFPKKF